MNRYLSTAIFLDEVSFYVEKGKPYLRDAKIAAATDPAILDIWLDVPREHVIARRTHGCFHGAKIAGLDTVYLSSKICVPEPCWCCLHFTPGKSASLTEQIQGVTGWNDMYYPPSPLAAMVTSGILGAGLGYGGTALASGFLPSDWDKRKLRRSGLLTGAALGAAPGALETFKSLLIGQPVTDGSHMKLRNEKGASFGVIPHSPHYSTGPVIDADAMMKTVWKSPMVSGNLTPKEQTLFTGAMAGSQQIAGSPYVTPTDMARLTAGMGVGYASGLVAGKVLGALTGLPPSAQKTLANTGMYAGVVKSVLPMIYGIR